jgi:hypothetical protein
MQTTLPSGDDSIDKRGVDLAQIRRMLALNALERLQWLQESMDELVELRRLNEKHTVR